MDLVLNFLNTTTIAILSLLFFCLFLYNHHSKLPHAKEAPTVSGSWPILGHLHLFISTSQTPHRTLGALADKYGPLFTIKLGSKKTLVLSNWEMAKECFTTNDIVVSSRPKLVALEHLGYNQAVLSFAPYGPYWRELRKIATLQILSNRRVEQLHHVRVSEVQISIKELFNVWSSKKNEDGYVLVELRQWFSQLTFNMALRMIVGKRYFGATNVDDEKAQRCIKAIKEFMHLLGVFTVADAVPWLRWFDFGGQEKAMKETAKELDKILGEWLEEHRQNRALGEEVDQDQYFMDTMLSLLDGTSIDGINADTIIKSMVLVTNKEKLQFGLENNTKTMHLKIKTVIAGSIDTSTVTLIWAICLILRNPLVLEKAKAELDIQVGKERFIDESDICKLEYLQAIVKETLRLYPPGPLSAREFTENCTLGGYNIKKGTHLITNIWKIHTDPNVWTDPLEFKPERFLTTHKDIDIRGQHFELLPFGSGRRICPGISFGLQMVHLTLASFLHSFEILNPSNEPVDMSESLGLSNIKVTPLEILIKPHLSPNCYEII